MLKRFLDWLLDNGILFGTLVINLISAFITTMIILIFALCVSWWEKNT